MPTPKSMSIKSEEPSLQSLNLRKCFTWRTPKRLFRKYKMTKRHLKKLIPSWWIYKRNLKKLKPKIQQRIPNDEQTYFVFREQMYIRTLRRFDVIFFFILLHERQECWFGELLFNTKIQMCRLWFRYKSFSVIEKLLFILNQFQIWRFFGPCLSISWKRCIMKIHNQWTWFKEYTNRFDKV